MSNSQSSSIKFAVFATVTVLAAAGGLAALWPVVHRAFTSESAALVADAAHAAPNEAATDYQLAAWLDPANTAAFGGLARAQIAAGQPDAAVLSLQHAGQGSDVAELRVRTLLELGHASEAADQSAGLTGPDRSQADVLLAALADLNAGRPDTASALASRLSSPEAAGSLARAQSGQLGLAAELYATGLLRSSSAILQKSPTSYERNLLLARINYTQHTRASLSAAASLLATANALNPANTEARLLLAKVDRALGQTTDAANQEALAAKILSGRP